MNGRTAGFTGRDAASVAAVALVFAVLWGWSEYRRGRADERTWAYSVALRHLAGELDILFGGPPCQGFSTIAAP